MADHPTNLTREEADDWFDEHYGSDLMHDDPEFYDLWISMLMGDA